MKILITGGAGFIGSYLAHCIGSDFDAITTDIKEYPGRESHYVTDLSDYNASLKLLETVKPDVIIHSAAMKNLLRCNNDPESAERINVRATQVLARYARKNGSFVVYLSSDQVFDGRKGLYTEDDTANPINVYGKTKLAGERAFIDEKAYVAICRTAMVYGHFPRHLRDHVDHETSRESFENADQSLFPQWTVERMSNGHTIRVYSDRYCSPTFIEDLGTIIRELIKRRKPGIFHAGGPERVNREEYAQKIARIWGLDSNLIVPITYQEEVERPADCSLVSDKIHKVLGTEPISLEDGLTALKDTSWR